MNLAFHLRQMRREARGSLGRLAFFVACLAVGVAAVVAVSGLSTSLDRGIRTEARKLLAADLALSSRRAPDESMESVLDRRLPPGTEQARLVEMVTVASGPVRPDGSPGPSQLVELKAVDGPYPLYGDLRLEPARPLSDLLTDETVVVAPDLLSRLKLSVGDALRLGGERFTIAGVVSKEPDRVDFGLTLGPRVFLSVDGLERTSLIAKGSRVDYGVLLGLPETTGTPELESLAEALREDLPAYVRVQTYKEAQPALRSGLRRLDRYLGLVALLSLLVGGVGVAQTVRSWLSGRLDAIAVLKCLGLRPREIVTLYLGQATLLGLVGSVVGAAAGIAVVAAVPYVFPELVPPELIRWVEPQALLRGMGLGVGVALLFSAPPLVSVWSIPPARVLRRDAEPLRGNRVATVTAGIALAVGVWAMAALQSRSLVLGLQFVGGLLGVTLLLALGARLLTRRAAVQSRGMELRPWLRHGIAALARPGAGTLGAIVALGLGILVVLSMALVERQLARELTAQLPETAPSAFLVDIQPDQWPQVRKLLTDAGGTRLESVPVVTARIREIDGVPVDTLVERIGTRTEDEGQDHEDRSRRWALTREQRITYLETLPEDNEIVAGELWSRPEGEVSVEQEFAEELGVEVGSELVFDVQGVPVSVVVGSLRTVQWDTFGLNFFLVAEPGVFDEAPQQRVATVILPQDREQVVQDALAEAVPNVTFLRVREILERIVAVLDRLGLGVRFLGLFTVLAGLAILAGAVSASAARRGREVALLKTLGMTRRDVAAGFSVEYALVGLVAGVLGAVGGTGLAWAVLTRGMDVDFTFDVGAIAAAVVGAVLLTVTAGLAASVRALRRRPIATLREEG